VSLVYVFRKIENRLDDAANHYRPEDGLTVVYSVGLAFSLLTIGPKVRISSNWITTLTAAYFQRKIIGQLVGNDSGNGPRQVIQFEILSPPNFFGL
jgi:hypothetical protein